MSRWIDADALKAEIKMDIEDDGLQEKMVFYRINEAPSIDIVRCGECKHGSDNKVYGCSLIDFNTDDYHRMYTSDFCSYGERKESE